MSQSVLLRRMSPAVAASLLISLLVLSLTNSAHVCVPRDAPDLPPQPLPDHRINDDYCDCADASDENRTSACSNGLFTCKNAQYRPVQIYSSWVHDGSCDCCDGSDEPAGSCSDSCALLRAEHLKEATRKADIVRRGIAIRKTYVRDVEKELKNDVFEQSKLEKQLASVERQLKSHEQRAEVLRKRRDWEKGIKPTTSEDSSSSYEAPPADSNYDSEPHYDYEDDEIQDYDEEDEYDTNYGDDGAVDELLDADDYYDSKDVDDGQVDEPQYEDEDPELDDHMREEENAEHAFKEVPEEKVDDEGAADLSPEEHAPEQCSSTDCEPNPTPVTAPEPSDAVDVDSLCAELESSSPNWFVRRMVFFKALFLGKIKRVLPEKLVPSIATQTSDLNNCINKAESAKWDLDSKKREIEGKIDKLKKKKAIDFGEDKALRKLYGSCTKGKVTQYEFEICMFDTVRQYENGASIAQLGKFEGWEGKGKDRVMKYSEGDRCWNGPQRSIRVELSCSDKEEVVGVDEPNRCTYRMKFKTPAVCEEHMIDAIMADFSNQRREEKEEL
eukprot:TRINITY_DN1649_c0_g1_i1.p1 TRINITY_DN1649_c0_g1~~TRINITY_DN1649_c0_g1_i1.p1  ORF type:complete len:556 (-),score=99.60 TRINITY_DN1649_c0_g1_i1:420-2087(-)